jgi:hypothetical protein
MTRTASLAAASVAAVGFVVAGSSVIGHKIPDQNWGIRGTILDIAFAVGALGVAAALPALAALLDVGRVGRAAMRLAQAGHLAIAVECLVSTARGGNTLGVLFVVGLLASLVGLAALAVSGVRASAARLLAPLPILGLLVGIAGGDRGGAIVIGVVWGVLAAAITRTGPQEEAAQGIG